MHIPGFMLPSRLLILLCGATAAAFAILGLLGLEPAPLGRAALLTALAGALAVFADACMSVALWRRAPLSLRRRLPRAFALGAPAVVRLDLENPGGMRYTGELFDHADPSLEAPGMPLRFSIGPRQRQALEVSLLPTRRGMQRFDPAQIRLRSRLGLLDWSLRIGETESRRVFPNFEQQARFAWLAGDRRLVTPGLKAVQRRGSGTDFDQLVNYGAGDPIRQIDWKATLKHQRPIVRKFRDDRDQSVMFLLDCGRRMRADDTQQGVGMSHFDQSLNALMLLAFVALSHGDAVGAMTFGLPEGREKSFAPRKGRQTLNSLMAELADVEPTPVFSDYERAAAEILARRRKRGLLVMITNCRHEDAPELKAALRALRSRHLVVLANLREQIVANIAAQEPATDASALESAAALQCQQERADMLRGLAQGGASIIDCEPARLGVEMVNRYRVLKGAGTI